MPLVDRSTPRLFMNIHGSIVPLWVVEAMKSVIFAPNRHQPGTITVMFQYWLLKIYILGNLLNQFRFKEVCIYILYISLQYL